MNALRISAAQQLAAVNPLSERATALTLVRRSLPASQALTARGESSTYLSRPVDSYTWSVAVATYGGGLATYTAPATANTQQAAQEDGEGHDALFSYILGGSDVPGVASQYDFYASLTASATLHTIDLYA